MSLSSPFAGSARLDASLPPAAEHFPAYPVSWYLFGTSKEIRNRPLTKTLLGRQLAAFRTASGRIAMLDARCSHLGADLGRGRVIGESIRCPYHHWEYGPDGRCTKIPSQTTIPAFAHQTCYPVAERHGYVFFFNGPEPLFPLPFFAEFRPEEMAGARLLQFRGGFPWYMAAANSFDFQHWQAAHNRKLLGPPTVDCPHRYARRIRFQALVTGNSIFDQLLRRFAGSTVEVSITNWGGTFNLVTGFFSRIRSYLIVDNQPAPLPALPPQVGEGTGGGVLINVIVFAPRSGRPIEAAMLPISLWLRRLFTRGFIEDEFHQVVSIHYSPLTLIESDREMIELLQWAASLPRERNSQRRSELTRDGPSWQSVKKDE